MKSQICELLNIEFPMVAFSHCRDVVVAVSKAGGMGVLGAVGHTPEMLEQDLKWIDEHIEGKPYGVDILVPTTFEGKGSSVSSEDLPLAPSRLLILQPITYIYELLPVEITSLVTIAEINYFSDGILVGLLKNSLPV